MSDDETPLTDPETGHPHPVPLIVVLAEQDDEDADD